MKANALFLAGMLALGCASGALGADSLTSLHPEAAHPDPSGPITPDPYSGFIRQVQERLSALGFDAGPANGDFGTKTQAALAQFQLSSNLPASGSLDDLTLQELGIERPQREGTASTGESASARR